LIRAGPTRFTVSARQEHLDRDPITFAHSPTSRGPPSDLFDDADGLVARNERETRKELAGELLMVCAAQTARFHPQQSIVVTNPRQREVASRELARRYENQRTSRPHETPPERTCPTYVARVSVRRTGWLQSGSVASAMRTGPRYA
jgi:hypothetical protein